MSQHKGGKTLEAIKYEERGNLKILNQLVIPHKFEFEVISSVQDGFDAIREMKVRGAPAIAIVAMLSLAVELNQLLVNNTFSKDDSNIGEVKERVVGYLDHLAKSRPTAVNLFVAIDEFKGILEAFEGNNSIELIEKLIVRAESMIDEDIEKNSKMSEFGSDYILKLTGKSSGVNVLTHCNTGALATTKYGTALGVIRFLHKKKALEMAYNTETRPFNQGARLTSFELAYEEIPVTLLVDSAVSYLFKTKNIDCVVVGADRICNNGDTANKIGTYQIALSAMKHNVSFFVAAPLTSIDTKLSNGDKITIEQRDAKEITHNPLTGTRVVAENVNVFNPSFDVTPAHMIKAIFTEYGVIGEEYRNKDGAFDVLRFIDDIKQ